MERSAEAIELVSQIACKPIDYTDIPMTYWPSHTLIMLPDGRKIRGPIRDKISAVCRSMDDCDDLVAAFEGHVNFCPDLPILLLMPDGNPKMVAGLGYSTAAELRDCCVEVWGVSTGSDAHKRFNNDELRERHGMARREDVTAFTQEAFHERRQRHLASPVTDPVKQYTYPNPTHKVQFSQQPDNASWTEANS